MSNCDGRVAELAFPESQNRKNTESGLETFMTKEKDDAFVCLFKCWMDECWVKRPETVVTNEKEAARMIKLVRPRWKRSDLVLQVSFWCYPVESALSILTISYDQRISPLCSNHCWVAYNLNNSEEERLLIQTLPRFFCPIFAP